jgi:hypothetical protein
VLIWAGLAFVEGVLDRKRQIQDWQREDQYRENCVHDYDAETSWPGERLPVDMPMEREEVAPIQGKHTDYHA